MANQEGEQIRRLSQIVDEEEKITDEVCARMKDAYRFVHGFPPISDNIVQVIADYLELRAKRLDRHLHTNFGQTQEGVEFRIGEESDGDSDGIE